MFRTSLTLSASGAAGGFDAGGLVVAAAVDLEGAGEGAADKDGDMVVNSEDGRLLPGVPFGEGDFVAVDLNGAAGADARMRDQWRLGNRGSVRSGAAGEIPPLSGGESADALMPPLRVVPVAVGVEQGLQLRQIGRWGLFTEPPLRRLVDAFVLAVALRMIDRGGDRSSRPAHAVAAPGRW